MGAVREPALGVLGLLAGAGMTTLRPMSASGLVLRCSACGQANRIPYGRLSGHGVCGKCKSELPHASQPIELRDPAEFGAIVREADVPVLVDYWAPWCGPCRMVAPELEKLAAERAGRLLIVKVNTQEHPQIGQSHRVRAIPTMALYLDGSEAARFAGARPASQIGAWVDGQGR